MLCFLSRPFFYFFELFWLPWLSTLCSFFVSLLYQILWSLSTPFLFFFVRSCFQSHLLSPLYIYYYITSTTDCKPFLQKKCTNFGIFNYLKFVQIAYWQIAGGCGIMENALRRWLARRYYNRFVDFCQVVILHKKLAEFLSILPIDIFTILFYN